MFPEGSGFYADYQNGKYGFNTDSNRGADTFIPFKSTSTLPVIGLNYSGGYAMIMLNVEEIINSESNFYINPLSSTVNYKFTNDKSVSTDWNTSTTSGFNNKFANNIKANITELCKNNSSYKYFAIITVMVGYGSEIPFKIIID